ncbi:thioesterase II family protein [Micromonospora echinospora]
MLAGRTAPAARLVCFPHSGGSATAFGDWAAVLPPGVELVAVQYPGRGDRFVEDLVDDVAQMASHVVAELLGMTASNTVLFGHSLGATVAYESALLLRDIGEQPAKLCVSACLPPGHMADRDVHLAPDEEFWATLCSLGGIEPAVAENTELRDVLLPTLRSDLRAHATYRPGTATKPLSCPLSCYHGAGDPLVDERVLPQWATVTSGAFDLKVRPGGHFHLTTDPGALISDILS